MKENRKNKKETSLLQELVISRIDNLYSQENIVIVYKTIKRVFINKLTVKNVFLITLIVILFSFTSAYSQQNIETQEHTKFGLVLSGGGAKGLAHVGVLRMIDSLQIHIDYLTGTSMGSVISGLYSIGYSGDSIKSITKNSDWQRIISNRQPYNLIHIREKDEYDAYAFEFPVVKGIPSLPNYIIEGQYLFEILQKFTFPVRDIHDFHKLPTPLEIMTSDIVDGGLIIQQSGYLPLAIRASLSIPAIFSPVIINNKMLVDGGLDRNYPVEEIKNMGADYVIGSYTGLRRLDEEEIRKPWNLINQTYALNSQKDIEKQKNLANITLDFSTSLKGITAADFKKYNEIVEIGEREARKIIPQLLEIKKMQIEQGIQYKHVIPKEKSVKIDLLNILDESGEKVSEESAAFVRGILGNNLQELDNAFMLQEKTENIMGYNFADKVFYTYSTDSLTQQNSLNFFIKKKPEGIFQAAVHYDTKELSSIILNYTYRNLLFNNSRFTAKVNVAERAKARVNYYKFLNSKGNIWIKGEFFYNLQKSNDLYFKYLSQLHNYYETNYNQTNLNASFSTGISFTHNNELQIGVEFNKNKLLHPRNTFPDAFFERDQANTFIYKHDYVGVGLSYNQNNLNKKYFATRGNKFQVQSKLFLRNRYELHKPEENNKAATEIYTMLNPDSSLNKIQGNILQLSLYEHFVQPLSQKIALHARFFYGVNIDVKKPIKESLNYENYLFLSQKFYMGGYANLSDNNDHVFTGLRTNEYPVNNISSLYLGLQYNVYGKLHITPSVSIASELNSFIPFSKHSDDLFGFGYGLDVDYMSFLGPIKLSISRSNLIDRNRIFFSFGYMF